MTIRFAINGFGRIGRSVARAYFENSYPEFELVAVNGIGSESEGLHLFKYDSVHGRFKGQTEVTEQGFSINGKKIVSLHQRNPKDLPWRELKVDVVLECTGAFHTLKDNQLHLDAGASKVIISAPAKDDAIKTVICLVNENVLTKADNIISIGSCTTNCLAPIVKILHEHYQIERGYVTTIHAYTNDQNVTDASHKDLRRARAAALSMIPTSTGAAKAIGKVIPELNGRLDGCAIRVPTPNVSMIDFSFTAHQAMTETGINNLIKQNISRVVGYSEEPLVSIDYNHTLESSIFDATGTKVIDGKFARVAAWYDNEWSFACRMLDTIGLLF
jgi:glyceraldehyde 3-phosphate dehydrogenase